MTVHTIEYLAAPVQRVTSGPRHHFFGYYDKCPWDATGRRMLAMQSPFADRNPSPTDALTIGVIDLDSDNHFTPLTTTTAWNWQQGCMLRWLAPGETDTLCFNDRRDDRYIAVLFDLETRRRTQLPHALYDIASHGRVGATLNFKRLADVRPGYGYFGLSDPFADQCHPADDGIYVVDMQSGSRQLIFSVADAMKVGEIHPDRHTKSWFNHIKFNPDGSRLLFLHRWALTTKRGPARYTRLFTIDVDGSNPRCLIEDMPIVSHFDWRDDQTIVVWLEDLDAAWGAYALVNDPTGERSLVGESWFDSDGHCGFSPDRRWMITDSYPLGPRHEQTLILYSWEHKRRVDVGIFPSRQVEDPSWRCDLHPRWNRKSDRVCIDSTQEGARQIYIVDLRAAQAAFDD